MFPRPSGGVSPLHRQCISPNLAMNFILGLLAQGLSRYKQVLSPLEDITLTPLYQLINKIRHQAKFVASLPPELQHPARDAYNASLKTVFLYTAISTFFAFLVRLLVGIQSSGILTKIRSFEHPIGTRQTP